MSNVSVVIPTHRRPILLKRAIDSILAQSLPVFEIIVVDDASCIETRSLVEGYALDNLIYIQNIDGQGASSSRNLGVKNSRGEVIAFLDDDDTFFVNKIMVLNSYMHEFPFGDVYYHPAKILMVNECISYISRPQHFDTGTQFLKKMLVSNFVGGTPMVVVRRSAFIEIGGFDETLSALEDYELWLRLAIQNKKFILIKEPLTHYNYITRNTSVSKNIEANRLSLVEIRRKHERHYESLDKEERVEHYLWQKRMFVHKYLLNGQILNAILMQAKVLLFKFSLKDMLGLFVMFLGPKVVFKIKSRLS